jgi:hypothetical protein
VFDLRCFGEQVDQMVAALDRIRASGHWLSQSLRVRSLTRRGSA